MQIWTMPMIKNSKKKSVQTVLVDVASRWYGFCDLAAIIAQPWPWQTEYAHDLKQISKTLSLLNFLFVLSLETHNFLLNKFQC
jgi:hypothetical protein